MDEIIYKGNKIVCFSSNDFQAFIINKDGEVERVIHFLLYQPPKNG